MERSYQFLIKEINDPQMASETSRDTYYTLDDIVKIIERSHELEKDIKALREAYDLLQYKYNNFKEKIIITLEE